MNEKEYINMIKKLGLSKKDEDYFIESKVGRLRNKYVLDMFKNLSKDVKILNVGDGTGTISKELELMGFKNITAIDINEKFIEIARKRCNYTKFIIGNAHNLPFKDESFDVITYVDVIEFLDLEKTLKEASRVIKKGGFVYMENFNKITLHYLKKIPFINIFVKSSPHYNTNTHFRTFKLIKDNNFQVFNFIYLNLEENSKFLKRKIFKNLMKLLLIRKLLAPVGCFYLRKL